MKELEQKGVYMILNTQNSKKYIGSTSVSFKKRFEMHKWKLYNNKHKNSHLQHAWNKYGKKMFKFVILEIAINVLESEQLWIDKYDFEELYNINPKATGGHQFPPEVIEKRRQSMLKGYASGRIKSAMKGKIPWNKGIKTGYEPWNKGKKYISTNHLKVPKLNKGNRDKDKLTKRLSLPEIEVYDLNNLYLGTWRSAKDLEEWSLTDNNNLPINSRFNTTRMNKPITFLQSVNINKSCKYGKTYKGLIFKYKHCPS